MDSVICRGEETVEGAARPATKKFGTEQQYIYPEDHHVIWTELEVCIGYPMPLERSEIGVFSVAPCFDGSRRCTRVIPFGQRCGTGLDWTKFPKTPEGKVPRDMPLATPIITEAHFQKALHLGVEDALIVQQST